VADTTIPIAPASGGPVPPVPPRVVVYPESDGKPMADNTKQARWIFVLFGNLLALYRTTADIFVAADLFWYAVEGDETARAAPDVMVVFGRPRGDRGSYMQWLEDNIAPAVVFEILSPSNTYEEMDDKLLFYEEHGVQEYYIYNPDNNTLRVHLRVRDTLRRVRHKGQHVSERLGIRFDLTGPEMVVYYPNGRRFLNFDELEAEREREAQRADKLQAERDQEAQRADRAEQMAARLAELGQRLLLGQASDEERQEFQRLTETQA
jgi:Uma2 family endonuclease